MGKNGEKKPRKCLGPDCEKVFETTPEHRLCTRCSNLVVSIYDPDIYKIKIEDDGEGE